MPGKVGLLVNAVGNFDGSAFVPPKNQQNGERGYGTSARRERGFIFKISGRVARATLLTSIGLGSDAPPSLATYQWWCHQWGR